MDLGTLRGVGFKMRRNIHVLQFVPLLHDSEHAYATVALSDFPIRDHQTMQVQPGVRVYHQQLPHTTDQELVLAGTSRAMIEAARNWPDSLATWRTALLAALQRAGKGTPNQPLQIGEWQLPWHERTLVMGIVNVTPDSFSDGGEFATIEAAVTHARELVAAGADIIDIGGESTRPAGVYADGAEFVTAAEEKNRVLPIIARLAKELDVPISIDTYKAEVAEAAILSGAHIVNDVWGLKRDPQMAAVVAHYGVPVVVMHNREKVHYDGPLMREIINDLWESVERAHTAGVRDERIILDPGIGFAKTYNHNITVMHHLQQLTYMGYPVLLGTSRKSLIGQALELPIDQRVEGTAATVSVGIAKGCRIVRVHDVQEMTRVCRMTDALLHPHKEEETVDG